MVKINRKWGAMNTPSAYEKVPWDVRELFVVHHTTGATLGRDDPVEWLKAIDHYHGPDGGHGSINRGLGYNVVMSWGKHPELYMGRGLDRLGAHASGFNTIGVGVAVLGDYREGRSVLTDEMRTLLRELYLHVCDLAGSELKPVGHGDVAPTSCPGGQLQTYVDAGLPPVVTEDIKAPVKSLRDEVADSMNTINLSNVTNRRSTFVTDPDMGRLQTWLANAGQPPANSFDSRGRPDRVGGPATRAALGRFQERHRTGRPGSPHTPDYVAGRATWRGLSRV